jgi:hypothetical protein
MVEGLFADVYHYGKPKEALCQLMTHSYRHDCDTPMPGYFIFLRKPFCGVILSVLS